MDFHGLLYAAHKNEVSKDKKGPRYYPSTFAPPKKEEKSKGLSVNVQKFLARKEEEEKKKRIEEERKREALFQLRNQDNKAKKRVQVMLKRTKSYNKSVIEDAIDEVNTADTVNGPQQCDEDDYGYVSQEASAFYSKMMDKYGSVTPEKFKSSKTKKVSGDLLSTKDRVKLALQRQEEEEMGPHKRKRKKKHEDDDEKEEANEPEQSGSHSPEISQSREKEEKPKPRRPAAPPPLDFSQLLKMAEKKQYEPPPLEVKLKEKRLQQKEPERLMTKKEKLEYERTRDKRLQREQGSSANGKRENQQRSAGSSREPESSRTDHDREKPREKDRQRQQKEQASRQEADRQRQQKEQASRQEADRQRQQKEQASRQEADRQRQQKEQASRQEADRQREEDRRRQVLKAREEERARRQREAEKEQERERVRERERRKEQERELDRRREEDRSRQREQERRRELEARREQDRREREREALRDKKKLPSIPKKTFDDRGYSRAQSPTGKPSFKPSPSMSSNRPKEPLKSMRKEDTAGKVSKYPNEKFKSYDREGKAGDVKRKPQEKKELISDLFGDRDSASPEKYVPAMKPDKPKPPSQRPVERIKVSGTSNNLDDLFGDAVTIRTKTKPVPNNNNKLNAPLKPSEKAASSSKPTQSGSKMSQEDLRKSKAGGVGDRKRPIESNGRPVPEKRPKLNDSRPSDGRGPLQNGAGRSAGSSSSRPPMKMKEFPPKDLKSRQFPPPDVRSRQFPPPDVRSRQFPPPDVARNSAAAKRRLQYERADSEDSSDEDEDEEYDSELDDFIDDGPEEGEDYSKYIRDIFGYDKSRYNGIDDDDDECMESNFAQVMCEEKRSARIGLMEDIEDMKKEHMEKQLKALKKMKGRR